MMMRTALLPAFALTVTACAAPQAAEPAPPMHKPVEKICDASALQEHIGHKASERSGAILLELSGARTLRWVPPRTAVTMDYRPDRLTVSYDDNYVIERISCG
ncbi:MAG: hypothetical protein APF78_03475 [Sphingomonadales bacterium BRH_c3]|nr:MAG: hypothetical protein APF78_03475 [Sphingomonadales bacterium BRH_c3]